MKCISLLEMKFVGTGLEMYERSDESWDHLARKLAPFAAAEAATIADNGGASVEMELLEMVRRLGSRVDGGREGGAVTPSCCAITGCDLESDRETAGVL